MSPVIITAIERQTRVRRGNPICRSVANAPHDDNRFRAILSTRNRNVPLLSEIEMSPSNKNGLWALVENLKGFPRRGGRGLCVHRADSVHGPLHRFAARQRASSRSAERVSRRHG
jgi:hypothetical protein